ncbi:hypothetical protein DFH08DRAFT_939129 [Mycena albidolilacea]|uniref:Uncharacterized protein n=1 Tax=Mycena albidolilacea TaxID=1033008 RepID=A0AAD6ZTG3_9AGAR|nr:hypothetical protein DFH08DRAFT_939129 [Mycena albidolilacea]
MSLALTFADKRLLRTSLVGPDGGVHYTTTTTHGWRGRKHKKVFEINGVQRKWDELKSRSNGFFSTEREWNWGGRPFKFKYHNSHQELLAIPTKGSVADTMRFTTHRPHLMRNSQHAVLYFPYQMRDELERMFLLLAVLQTEIHRQDMVRQRNGAMADMAASGGVRTRTVNLNRRILK